MDKLFEAFHTTKAAAWESDYPSVARLSRVIMGGYGQRRTMVRERDFHFQFQADPEELPCLAKALMPNGIPRQCEVLLYFSEFATNRDLTRSVAFPEWSYCLVRAPVTVSAQA